MLNLILGTTANVLFTSVDFPAFSESVTRHRFKGQDRNVDLT